MRGYDGLMCGDFVPLDRRSVSNIIGLGGTILKTSRAEEFCDEAGQKAALAQLRARGVDGLIVIGGNGSLAGARVLAETARLSRSSASRPRSTTTSRESRARSAPTRPSTWPSTPSTRSGTRPRRSSASSSSRSWAGSAAGWPCRSPWPAAAKRSSCRKRTSRSRPSAKRSGKGAGAGKASWIIVVAEGRSSAADVASAVTAATGLETRIAVLGHIQRGGRPTAIDRIMAARLGNAAVEALAEGRTGGLVHLAGGRVEFLPFGAAGDVEEDRHRIRLPPPQGPVLSRRRPRGQ